MIVVNLTYHVFFSELINICQKQNDMQTLNDLYHEISSAEASDPQINNFPKNILRKLALIRLSLILQKNEDLEDLCQMPPAIKSFTDLTTNYEGIPPDWTFTVLDYTFAVHCRLIQVHPNAAYALRNFLFKNFAFKLRGVKRVSVMTILFAGLCHDFVSLTGTPGIVDIGEYVLKKFACEKYLKFTSRKPVSEIRLYVCIVCVFMADMVKMLGHDETKFLNAARIYRKTRGGYISSFIKLAVSTIEKRNNRAEKISNKDIKRHSLRWKTAIVKSRLDDESAPVTESVKRWLNIIDKAESLLIGKKM